jgi:hypothetical protein
VLKKPRTSNKMLHELARAVRGIEIKRGKSLNSCPVQNDLQQLGRTIAPVLRRGHDYFTEFLAKLSIVTKPEGETLESAFQGSQSRQPPSKVLPVPNEGLQSLASLCRELQEMFRDQPHHAVPSGHCEAVQSIAADHLRLDSCAQNAACPETEPAIKNVKAARYYFIEWNPLTAI